MSTYSQPYISDFIKKYIDIVSKKLDDIEEKKCCDNIIQEEYKFKLVENITSIHVIILESLNTKINSQIYKILKDYYITPERHKTAFDYLIENSMIDEYFITTMIDLSKITPDSTSITSLFKNKFIMNNRHLILSIIKLFILHGLKNDYETKNIFTLNIYKELLVQNIDYEKLKEDLLEVQYLCDDRFVDILLQSWAMINSSSIVHLFDNLQIIPEFENVKYILCNPFIKDTTELQNIINILVIYGLKITKELVLLLLDKCIFINSLEKYGIDVDEDIYEKCAKKNFYPYKLTHKPTDNIIHIELSKRNNIDRIKKLKESGATFSVCCLEVAVSVLNNVKVLKFVVDELNIFPNETCVNSKSVKIENWAQIEILLKKYTTKQIILPQPKPNVKLNEQSTIIIEPKKIIIKKEFDYNLKNKIKKFLNYKPDTIKYDDLYELIMKYLAKNNLIIGDYFVIDNGLSDLFKINNCSILHIDQIDNIITYLINE